MISIQVGETHNHLTVIALDGFTAVCECRCGTIKRIKRCLVANGHDKSCGCMRRNVKHRMASSKAYRAWSNMKDRCENPQSQNFARYGGRGIKVCPRWSASFEAFLKDMGQPPDGSRSIDRFPDNNGNYEPGNCRWATAREQANNRRNSILRTHQGRTLSAAEWARELGLPRSGFTQRLRRGWSIEKAITTPFGKAGSR